MGNNEQAKQRSPRIHLTKSLSVFGIEILSNGTVSYTCALHEDDIMDNESMDRNVDYLAHVTFQIIRTAFGANIYKKILDQLEMSGHENAQLFKHKFQMKIYELQRMQDPVVPASKVFGS